MHRYIRNVAHMQKSIHSNVFSSRHSEHNVDALKCRHFETIRLMLPITNLTKIFSSSESLILIETSIKLVLKIPQKSEWLYRLQDFLKKFIRAPIYDWIELYFSSQLKNRLKNKA